MNNASLSRNIWGVALLAVGIGFLLDALNVIKFNDIAATWWPTLIVIGGLGALIGNPRNYVFPVGFALVGVLLQLEQLGYIDVNVYSLIWPIIIIAVGWSLLFRNRMNHPNTSDETTTNLFAALAGIDNRVTTQIYKGGKASAVLGGISLDIRKANIKDVAELEVFTFWGGIELKVPENWHVNVSGTPLMGGWDNKADKPKDKKAPTLNINATCIMGGVEIKN